MAHTASPTADTHTLTREQAHAACPPDSYVEYYGGQWLIVPYAPVTQPAFFTCTPTRTR